MGETPPADAARDEAAVTGQDLEDVTAALLARPLELSRHDVSRDAHVSLNNARRFWQALGFPLVNNDELLFTRADVDALRAAGYRAFLVGERFMRQRDPGAALAELIGDRS